VCGAGPPSTVFAVVQHQQHVGGRGRIAAVVTVIELPGWSGNPRARLATATGTTSGCVIGARSGVPTPSGIVACHLGGNLDQPAGSYPRRLRRSASRVGSLRENCRGSRPSACGRPTKRRQLCRKVIERRRYSMCVGEGIRCEGRDGTTAETPDGARQIAQTRGGPEIVQPRLSRGVDPSTISSVAAEMNGLAAVREVAQPSGLVDRRARVIALVA